MDETSARAAIKAQEAEIVGRLPLRRAASALLRLGYALAALALFVLALKLLQQGAAGLEPLLERLAVDKAVNTLGFGWLGAYLLMSGSPVAAISLTLFSSDVLSDLQTFTMINGSRLGASFIVLLIGFLYYLRGRRYPDGVYIGVIALLVTATIYLPAMGLGSLALTNGWLDGVRFGAAGEVHSALDAVYGPATEAAVQHLPRLSLFVLGVALLWGSFQVFDRALPAANNGNKTLARVLNLIHRPYAMFALGLLITALTLSVAVSLTMLVPLSLKGYVRREYVIPYVMGANISTFVDTLFASLLLGTPRAFTIVLVEMLSVALVSALVLLLAYGRYRRFILSLTQGITHSRRSLAVFLLALFALPALLLVL